MEEKLLKEKKEAESGLKDFSQAEPKLKDDLDARFPGITGHSKIPALNRPTGKIKESLSIWRQPISKKKDRSMIYR